MRQVFIAPDLGRLFLVDSYELGQILPLLPVETIRCISEENSMVTSAQAIIPVRRDEMALLSPVTIRALVGDKPGGSGLVESLSEREIEVLHLVARGLTNKDIAQTLFLSIQTVKTHLHHIFGKLGVRSRTEAVWWVTHHGYGLAEQGIAPISQIIQCRGIE